ncbi:MAG: helix-turn-helix domain-containing protein [Rhodococcus sp. (in: high G+C Gram-positive bacteria)]
MAAGYDSLDPIIRDVAAALRPGSSMTRALPARVIEEMLFAARHGMPWAPLEDALRIGMAEFWEWLMANISRIGVDRATQMDALHGATRILFQWFDATIRQARVHFDAEHARIEHTASRRQADLVHALLAGRPVREGQLGHPLMRWHLASVIWRPGGAVAPAEIPHIVGRCPVLTTQAENGTVWVFIAMVEQGGEGAVLGALSLAPDLRCATGAVHHGPAGFVQSHHEATTTHALALRKLDGNSRRITKYSEVDIEILLLQDTAAASRMADTELGDLAARTPKANTIRQTVQAYLENACSTSAAADELHVSERTIRNRLATAETLLKRPLSERAIQLGAALRILNAMTKRDERADETILPAPNPFADPGSHDAH